MLNGTTFSNSKKPIDDNFFIPNKVISITILLIILKQLRYVRSILSQSGITIEILSL